ncbi:MAG TPA: hypothetical protein DIC23_14770 [Planctomycetaceae bacterium]|jgi:molybdopterin converting factor small subunit|nr:hypothetical protein [Planctomycetaceae bacterium]|tara:strand:+ start:334 stop:597 length:264 start_codon:yes stop_codon:yes gene_type:complete
MPHVHIPAPARDLTGGEVDVEIEASSVRRLIGALDLRFPGFADRVLEEGELKPGLRVAIDGHISPMGVLARLETDSQVHFLTAIGGG